MFAVVGVVVLALILPSSALAWNWFPYENGVNNAGGIWTTDGWAPREGNRVYHQAGRMWGVRYCGTAQCEWWWYTTSNPTVEPYPHHNYAKSYCNNVNDNSGVNWVCQSTRP